MIRIFKSLIIFILSMLLVACSGNKSISNIEVADTNIYYQNGYEVAGADPFVLVDKDENGNECLYLYLTSGDLDAKGFNVYKSYDLTDWKKDQVCFMTDNNTWCSSKLWAPEIIKDNGLYYMFYSAQWGSMDYGLYISVAVSDSPNGCFEEYSSKDKKKSEPLIQFEKHYNEMPIELRSSLAGKNGDIGFIKVIDASPFLDPKTNKKYLYFVADIGTDYTDASFIMCMEMEDWTTPIYSSLTRITKYNFVSPDSTDLIVEGGNTNEGCSVYYHDGLYYLTFSTNKYTTSEYQVRQAIADNPLGPFIKIQPDDGGVVLYTEPNNICQSSGHSSFFMVGDELFLSYHTFYNDKNIDDGRRAMVDRASFARNSEGIEVLQAFGPTVAPQLLPESITGYKNITSQAKITCENMIDNTKIDYLYDGIIPCNSQSVGKNFFANSGETRIKFDFDDYRDVCSVIVYPSYKSNRRISEIKSINLECQYSIYTIENVKISNLYDTKTGKMALDNGIIANFDVEPIKSIEIIFDSDNLVGIPEIVIEGK